MASKDPDDIEECNRLLQLNHYIGGLKRRISELDSEKKELEDVQKRLNEISEQFHRSDESVERKNIWKRFDELKELYNIKDITNSDLDLGVGSSSIGGPSKDDVKMEKKSKQVFDVMADTDEISKEADGLKERLDECMKEFEELLNEVIKESEQLLHQGENQNSSKMFQGLKKDNEVAKKGLSSRATTEKQDVKNVCIGEKLKELERVLMADTDEINVKADGMKKRLDKLMKESEDLLHQKSSKQVSTDTGDISTNIQGVKQELSVHTRQIKEDEELELSVEWRTGA